MMRSSVRAVAVLCAALPLAGCGLRIDEPDPTPAPPSAAEEVRQREALRAVALSEVALDSPAVQALASHAAEQADALGGVWVPWPDGGGPETLPPEPTPDVGPFTDPASVVTALQTTTPEVCGEAVTAEDEESALLYASLCLSRTLDLDALLTETGSEPVAVPELPADLITKDPELIVTLDAAAWATDQQAAAAKASEAGGWEELHARANQYRELALDAVIANGWEGTDQDPRLPAYEVGTMTDQTAIAGTIARVAVGAVPEAVDRQPILDLALTMGVTARRGGVEFEALPGVE